LLGFGIPTSRESFLEWEADPERDFIRRFLGGWPQYHHLFVSIFDRVAPALREWKVTIIEGLDLANLRMSFSGHFEVIILFAHWRGDAVELFGGFADPDIFLQVVPHHFSGLLDLCVCHPPELVKALRSERPRCLVKFLTTEATPGFWLYFYLTLFKYLQDNNDTYLGGLENTVKFFIAKGHRK
jgi:hypothetical protein